jgi:hypothetical protein
MIGLVPPHPGAAVHRTDAFPLRSGPAVQAIVDAVSNCAASTGASAPAGA